ncbi:unnamed protein product, partial [Dovyalis caffra]
MVSEAFSKMEVGLPYDDIRKKKSSLMVHKEGVAKSVYWDKASTWKLDVYGQGRTSLNESSTTESEPYSQNEEKKAGNSDDVLVQYVVLRRDLIDLWPMGSVVTQGCHASVFSICSHKVDPHTLQYCSSENIDSMHE